MTSPGTRKKITQDVAGSFLLRGAGTLLQLLGGVVLARFLGANGYGRYSFPLGVVTLLTIPATLGLPQLVTRIVSQYRAKNEIGLLRGAIVRSNQFALMMGVGLTLATAFVYWIISRNVSSEDALIFYVSLVMLPFIALSSLRAAALRGLHRVIWGLMPENVVQPVIFLLIIIPLAILVTDSKDPFVATLVRLASVVAAFAIGSIVLIRHTPRLPEGEKTSYDTRRWLKSTLPFMVLGAAQLINNQTSIVILGVLRPMADVGVFRTVVQGASLVVFVLMAVSIAISPEVSRLWTIGDRARLQRLITVSTRLIAASTLLAGAVLIIFGKFFLNTLFGPEFATGATALGILCAGQIGNGLAGNAGTVLNMTGHENVSATAVLFAAVINVILNVLLIPKLGLNGAALAGALSMMTWNVIMVIAVRTTTGLNTTIFDGWSRKQRQR